mgnify:CR=1 FL=1
MDLPELTIITLPLFIAALSQVIRNVLEPDLLVTRWIPLINIVLGIIGVLALFATGDVAWDVARGVVVGMAAGGLYGVVKATVLNK